MEKPPESRNFDDIDSFLVTGKSGDEIFHPGETAADMYIVREGEIELSWPPLAGGVRPVVRLHAGEFFGEESLFDRQSRRATARAITDYQLIRLDAPVFDRVVREDPGIAIQMIRSLIQRASREVHSGAKVPVLIDPATGKEFPITGEGELTVGRVSEAAAVKPEINLSELDPDRTLSRRHAHLLRRGGEVYLRAVDEARNGTFINGRRVGATQVRLNEGDQISFGLVKIVFGYR
jgi:cyclic nucleotide-binding protein/FHA domain-containing protein